MKKLLLSFTVVFSLSGCLMSPGTNSTLGCNPITGCSERNHYHQSVRKANIGAAAIGLAGAVAGASTGDPFITAAGALGGMVLGYSIGDAMDKVDEIYATINLRNALNNNPDGAYSVYTNPNKRVAVAAAPTSTMRPSFTTTVLARVKASSTVTTLPLVRIRSTAMGGASAVSDWD